MGDIGQIIKILPPALADKLRLQTLSFGRLNELRLRVGRNVTLIYDNKEIMHANPNSASIQAVKSGRYPLLDTHCCSNLVGPDVVQFNANHIKIADTTDPKQLSDAMLTGRKIAMQHLDIVVHNENAGISFQLLYLCV